MLIFLLSRVTPALWWGTYAALDLAWGAVTEWHRTGAR
jgi:hypothetical protein